MKICHVITRLIIGGAQENTVLTCRGLVDRGHDVTLIAGPETGPEGSLWDKARDAGCKLVRIDSLRRAVRPMQDLIARQAMRRFFEREQPDVVHTHSSKAGILARSAAHAAGVPIIVHTIHGMSFNRTQRPFTRWLYRFLEQRAATRTASLVTVADAMIDQATAAGVAPRDRFVTVRSGMDVSRFAPCAEQRALRRKEWGVGDKEIVVGTIARLFENKGYEAIIEAMPAAVADEPRLRFVWIGDGAFRSQYERRLEALGLRDRVHLTGIVPPHDIPSLVTGFDIILHASRWEGLPRAIVQGLLTEVPAISFDNDGAPEVVVPNETGILVPYGQLPGLAAAIVSLASDPDKRRAMGQAGRARCVESFDWHTMVAQLEALYERLVRDG